VCAVLVIGVGKTLEHMASRSKAASGDIALP
jgi:hypothetical protein